MADTYGYFLVTLCIIGTLGNLLTLVVLRNKKDKKKSTNWLLQTLAVADSLYLFARLLSVLFKFFACRYVEWLPLAVSRPFSTVEPYVESCASLFHMISVWIVVVITVDRYIVVCMPSEVQLRTVRRAKVAVACVAGASIVCCLPGFVEWKTGSTLSPLNCDDANPMRTDHSWWLIVHQIVCNCVLRTVIPLVVLVVLSSRIITRLRRMTRYFRKCRCSREQKKKVFRKINWRRSLTATLVAVMALFLGCQLPQLSVRVCKLLHQLLPSVLFDVEALLQADNVANGLLVVNATANFFVYCIVGNDFRRRLFQLLSVNNLPACAEKCEFQRTNVQKPMTAANLKWANPL